MSELASIAHSLILASGTLSPLDALSAELGLPFPVRLEASHVVAPDHVFAASLSHGPGGHRLCANYANQNAFDFQDDVGKLLLEASRTVSGGVLCFLPSYSLLDKLIQRWEVRLCLLVFSIYYLLVVVSSAFVLQRTGLLEKLARVKHVLQEPRSSKDFDEWMTDFYGAVDSTRGTPGPEGQTGALALAVCRGKVSEGLDFAADYARLVIAVGIPFPAFKNPQVSVHQSAPTVVFGANVSYLFGDACADGLSVQCKPRPVFRLILKKKNPRFDWCNLCVHPRGLSSFSGFLNITFEL